MIPSPHTTVAAVETTTTTTMATTTTSHDAKSKRATAIFAQSTKSDWERPAFWLDLVHQATTTLTIGSTAPLPTTTNEDDTTTTNVNHQHNQQQLKTRGYALVDEILFSQEQLQAVQQGIQALQQERFPQAMTALARCVQLFSSSRAATAHFASMGRAQRRSSVPSSASSITRASYS